MNNKFDGTEGIEPEKLIMQSIQAHGENLAVLCSFGKSSVMVLHMAIKIMPDVKVIFNNTLCQFPETIQYKKQLTEAWGLNLIETRPDKNFWFYVDKYGLPTIRKKGGRGSNAPKCCHYLKEKPALASYKEHNIKAVITGIQARESRNRELLAKKYDNMDIERQGLKYCAQRYFAPSIDLWRYHPIIYYSDKQIFEYYKAHKIPLNPVYTKWGGIYDRSGCLPCTAYLGWEKKLSKSHPALYRRIIKAKYPGLSDLGEFI